VIETPVGLEPVNIQFSMPNNSIASGFSKAERLDPAE
jgi:hypothetical protein